MKYHDKRTGPCKGTPSMSAKKATRPGGGKTVKGGKVRTKGRA